MDALLKNNIGLQVLTDTGWSDFKGLLVRGYKQTLLVKTTTRNIVCTLDHKFYKPNLEFIAAASLKPGSKLLCDGVIDSIVSVTTAEIEPVYDLLEVEKNHRFYANGILVKNCEFLIFDETLVSPTTLIDLSPSDYLYKQGQVRWFSRPEKGKIYVVALDPSLGTGGDAAAIQVIELPGCRQVAEWQHNKTKVQQQVGVIKEICQHIYESVGTDNDIYYSVENNTLGEAILVTIEEFGEENIHGIFLSEPAKMGQGRKYRKGFNTSNKTKLAACAKFKNMLETKKLTVTSANTISELKTFVASGASYAAKSGEKDDLVMSLLLAVRMIQALQAFDANLDATLRDSMADIMMPMPFIMF